MRNHRLIAGIISRGIESGEFRAVDPFVARMLTAPFVMHGLCARIANALRRSPRKRMSRCSMSSCSFTSTPFSRTIAIGERAGPQLDERHSSSNHSHWRRPGGFGLTARLRGALRAGTEPHGSATLPRRGGASGSGADRERSKRAVSRSRSSSAGDAVPIVTSSSSPYPSGRERPQIQLRVRLSHAARTAAAARSEWPDHWTREALRLSRRGSQTLYDPGATGRVRTARASVNAASADVATAAEQSATNAAFIYIARCGRRRG